TTAIDTLTTDRSDASGTGYWSPATGEYRPDLLKRALGRDAALPQVLAPTALAGHAHGVPLGAGAGHAHGAAAGDAHGMPLGAGHAHDIPLGAGAGDNAAAGLGVDAGLGDVVVSI